MKIIESTKAEYCGYASYWGRSLLMMEDNTLSDGTVTAEETESKVTDHIEMPAPTPVYNSAVPKQIDHFIKTNGFMHRSR